MNWSFATINNKIGEIYFEKRKSGLIDILGHCYVKRSEFKIAEELKALEEDIKKFKVIYRNKMYKVVAC